MKLLFLTRFDFTTSRKDGGLEISYRNYELVRRAFGDENIYLAVISRTRRADTGNIKYFTIRDNLPANYLTYVQLRDRIPRKTEKRILQYMEELAPDFIFFDGSTFGQLVRGFKKRTPSAVYFHNIERQYTWEQVRKYSFLCIFRYWSTAVNEKRMLAYTEHAICINQRDGRLLEKYYHRSPEFLLPATYSDRVDGEELERLGMEAEKEVGEAGKGRPLRLLFIGSYLAHNYKGLLWFIREVLPHVDASLTVVGKGMEKLAAGAASCGKVIVDGTVESLEEYYRDYDAMVMPIFMGGGMKVKTAEAMMYGKTIFASGEALEGYEGAEELPNIYRCCRREDFIEAITAYARSGARHRYNRDIRQLFLRKYCTDCYAEELKEYLLKCT